MSLPQRVRIGKKWWRVVLGKVPQGKASKRPVGRCVYSESTLYVSNHLGLSNQYSTLMHEILHAAIPRATERQVLDAERAIGNLWNAWADERD